MIKETLINTIHSIVHWGSTLNIIALLVNVFKIVFDLYRSRKDLRFNKTNHKIFDGSDINLSKVSLQYNNEPIERLTKTKIRIKNVGSKIIEGEDISKEDPILIKALSEDLRILDVIIEGQQFKAQHNDKYISVWFEFLNRGGYGIIEIVHNGTVREEFEVSGTVREISGVKMSTDLNNQWIKMKLLKGRENVGRYFGHFINPKWYQVVIIIATIYFMYNILLFRNSVGIFALILFAYLIQVNIEFKSNKSIRDAVETKKQLSGYLVSIFSNIAIIIIVAVLINPMVLNYDITGMEAYDLSASYSDDIEGYEAENKEIKKQESTIFEVEAQMENIVSDLLTEDNRDEFIANLPAIYVDNWHENKSKLDYFIDEILETQRENIELSSLDSSSQTAFSSYTHEANLLWNDFRSYSFEEQVDTIEKIIDLRKFAEKINSGREIAVFIAEPYLELAKHANDSCEKSETITQAIEWYLHALRFEEIGRFNDKLLFERLADTFFELAKIASNSEETEHRFHYWYASTTFYNRLSVESFKTNRFLSECYLELSKTSLCEGDAQKFIHYAEEHHKSASSESLIKKDRDTIDVIGSNINDQKLLLELQ